MIVATPREAAERLAPLFAGAEGEVLAVLLLGAGRQAIHAAVIADAPGGEVEMPVEAIVAEALRRGASAMVVAHNHPAGDPRPSPADITATRALADAASAAGIRLLDHLIFAGPDVRSFREIGLI